MAFVIFGICLGLLIAAAVTLTLWPDAREFVRDFLRDGIPLCLFWLGLRLMSRKCRRETVYSLQRRHTLRGIPEVDTYYENPA